MAVPKQTNHYHYFAHALALALTLAHTPTWNAPCSYIDSHNDVHVNKLPTIKLSEQKNEEEKELI